MSKKYKYARGDLVICKYDFEYLYYPSYLQDQYEQLFFIGIVLSVKEHHVDEFGMSVHYTLERWRKAQNFTFRLGKERLTFTEYDNVTLVTIPFKGTLLLVSTEPRINYDPIIEKINSILTDWEKI